MSVLVLAKNVPQVTTYTLFAHNLKIANNKLAGILIIAWTLIHPLQNCWRIE